MTEDQRAQPGPGQKRAWIPDVLGDRYDIDRELGSGAAAVTVAALDRKLGRRVAIKILKPESELDPEFSKRFAREARAAASINHPNVVSVYDVGQEGDLLYLVMQFVDGTDLKRLINQHGALSWTRAVTIARAVLAGLIPIHETGIVHRDIKPQNVLIGDDGTVKVTDFGVAHVELESQLTTAGMTVGTASYMAPEQAQGRTPTPAADVYAVGVMLYEMVAGKLPFSEPTSVATMLAHIQQVAEPPQAPAGMDAIPDHVKRVIQQALAKNPEERFRSASAMRRALREPTSSGSSEATVVVPLVDRHTEEVSSLRRDRVRPAGAAPASRAASQRVSPREVQKDPSGGGFGTVVVTFLVVLALGLLGAAGIIWYMDQQSGENGSPNQSQQPAIVDGGGVPTSTPADEAPGFIELIETEIPISQVEPTETQAATETPTPTDVPIATNVPTPTEAIIVPPTDEDEPQIIEPMEDSTVVSDP